MTTPNPFDPFSQFISMFEGQKNMTYNNGNNGQQVYIPQQSPTPSIPPQANMNVTGNWNSNPNQPTMTYNPNQPQQPSVTGWPQAIAASPTQETMAAQGAWSQQSAQGHQQPPATTPMQAMSMAPDAMRLRQPPPQQAPQQYQQIPAAGTAYPQGQMQPSRLVTGPQQPTPPPSTMTQAQVYTLPQPSSAREAALQELPDLQVGLSYLSHKEGIAKHIQTPFGLIAFQEGGLAVVSSEMAQKCVETWPQDFAKRDGKGQIFHQAPQQHQMTQQDQEASVEHQTQLQRLQDEIIALETKVSEAEQALKIPEILAVRQRAEIQRSVFFLRTLDEPTADLFATVIELAAKKHIKGSVALVTKAFQDESGWSASEEMIAALADLGIVFEDETDQAPPEPKPAAAKTAPPSAKVAKPKKKTKKK